MNNIVECDLCGGVGKLQEDASYGDGHLGFNWADCPACDGEGFTACEWCDEATDGACLYCEVNNG